MPHSHSSCFKIGTFGPCGPSITMQAYTPALPMPSTLFQQVMEEIVLSPFWGHLQGGSRGAPASLPTILWLALPASGDSAGHFLPLLVLFPELKVHRWCRCAESIDSPSLNKLCLSPPQCWSRIQRDLFRHARTLLWVYIPVLRRGGVA